MRDAVATSLRMQARLAVRGLDGRPLQLDAASAREWFDHGTIIVDRAEIEPGFFEAASVEILRARDFNDADRPETQPVVIVSEAMAQRSGRTETPSGDWYGGATTIRPDWSSVWLSDAKVWTRGEAPRNMIYRSYS